MGEGESVGAVLEGARGVLRFIPGLLEGWGIPEEEEE